MKNYNKKNNTNAKKTTKETNMMNKESKIKENCNTFNEYNAYIHEHSDCFVEIAERLETIKSKKLYQYATPNDGAKYNGFEDYTDREFGFSRAYVSQIRIAARAYRWLEKTDASMVDIFKRRCEFYYTLNAIPEENRLRVLQKLIDSKANYTATALRKIAGVDENNVVDGSKNIQLAVGLLAKPIEEIEKGMKNLRLNKETLSKFKKSISYIYMHMNDIAVKDDQSKAKSHIKRKKVA